METLRKFKQKVKQLKEQAGKIHLALQHARTPWPAKALALLTLAYLLSPIDLIPDFIPVLGLLDDLLIVPALIALCIRLIPADVMQEVGQAAGQNLKLQKKWYFALPVVFLYALLSWYAWGWVQE
ncbi:YkvA family protein [Nafulsella turpanensis]|uniref:YkvA family protein n=1 Tax=Nafulsella turpanensis TaxID=1265690 RepID=UPI0003484450